MPSTSLEATLHRSRHQLRTRDELMEKPDGTTVTNLCDWLHDTPVTNRKEKRRALGQAKHFGCYEEKVPDKERRTDTTWVHSRNCPRYDWKKAFDKKVAEQAAAPSAAEKVIETMFEGDQHDAR